jgi:hypothetical protein
MLNSSTEIRPGRRAALGCLLLAAAPALADTAWTVFTDPAEHAFTLEVPQGWRVAGGAYRFGPLDPRAMVEMDSPDGAIRLRFGDAGVPTYATPDRTFAATGFREGSRYSPNGVAQEVVAHYRSGWVFADLYGQARFATLCRSLDLKRLERLAPVHAAASAQQQVSAGDALYQCTAVSGAPMLAYVFAETTSLRMQSVGLWQVTWLYSVLVPPAQVSVAMQDMLHAMRTFRIDPQWEAYQLRLNGAAGDAAYRAFQENVQREQARFAQQEAQFQQQVDGMDRAIRGVTQTTDSVDGTEREVWTGPQANYFISPSGTVVNAPSSPGSQFHQLNPHN